jgi:hypothetical protein
MHKILLLSLFLGLTACNRSSPAEKTVKSLRAIQSWTATAQMVGETWQQGTIPDAYAEQTLKLSQEEIATETKNLFKPPTQHQPRQIQQTLQHLMVAIKHRQKAAIAAPLRQLSIQHQQLDAVLKAQEQS